MSNSLELRLVSFTNNEVYKIQGNTHRGIILEGEFEWNKIGGLLSFEVKLSRKNELPSFTNMRLEFYFRDEVFRTLNRIFTGYVDVIPNSENDSEIITLDGKGYAKKFEERKLDQTYTVQTIEDIINSLDYSGLDLDLTENNVSPPNVTIDKISFNDKSYTKVFERLLQIANNDISNNEYIWGIDENRGLYFKLLPTTHPDVKKSYFEGYNFQSPEVEFSDDIINSLTIFRATEADPKVTELVDTYEDFLSQSKYGLREHKLTVSDYMNDMSIELLATAVLEEKKEPKKTIKMNNFFVKDMEINEDDMILDDNGTIYDIELDDNSVLYDCTYRNPSVDDLNYFRILQPDYYGISNKPQIKNVLVNECDNLSEWTDATFNSTIVEDDTNVMTGIQAFKWTRNASQAGGDYIEFELESDLNNPLSIFFMIYFVNNVPNLKFTFYDSLGKLVDIDFDSSDERINTWLKIEDDSVTSSLFEEEDLYINNAGPEEILEIDDGVSVTTLAIRQNLGLRDLTKVRITLGEGTLNSDEFFIDRIQLKNNAWSYYRLSLDNANYIIKKDYVISELVFGTKRVSLVDEIKNKLSAGDIAYDLFSRS